MKKVLLSILTLCMAIVVNAQDLPYSKFLNFSKDEFQTNGFKYDADTNTWAIRKTNGWHTTLNVLAVIADAKGDGEPAYVKVVYYKDETYHKLLTFMKDNGNNMVETASGKLIKHQAFYGNYALELNMEQHIVSRTSARTFDSKAVKNVDESYNEYEFIINTGVEPWSNYLERQAAKRAKRDAKGKKKKTVDELM